MSSGRGSSGNPSVDFVALSSTSSAGPFPSVLGSSSNTAPGSVPAGAPASASAPAAGLPSRGAGLGSFSAAASVAPGPGASAAASNGNPFAPVASNPTVTGPATAGAHGGRNKAYSDFDGISPELSSHPAPSARLPVSSSVTPNHKKTHKSRVDSTNGNGDDEDDDREEVSLSAASSVDGLADSAAAAAAAAAAAGSGNPDAVPETASNVFRPNPSDVVIRAVNVHKTYLLGLDGVPALRGVSLSIARGEFIVILGKSGGGKTSMLNVLGTIDRPSKGELYIAGRRITSATGDEEFSQLRLRHLGFVFQQFNLIATRTARENVALPMVLDGRLPSSAIDKRAQFLLDKVGIGARSTHLPSQLSGGEQQRVTIARAIANCPDILLLDEPTGDLDSKNSHIILSLLVELNRREGITCIMVTHDNDLRLFAHRVVHMMDGKILRTEVIPQSTRDAQDAKLRQQLADDALDTQQLREQQGGVTEVRDPGFYGVLRPVPAEGNTAERI